MGAEGSLVGGVVVGAMGPTIFGFLSAGLVRPFAPGAKGHDDRHQGQAPSQPPLPIRVCRPHVQGTIGHDDRHQGKPLENGVCPHTVGGNAKKQVPENPPRLKAVTAETLLA